MVSHFTQNKTHRFLQMFTRAPNIWDLASPPLSPSATFVFLPLTPCCFTNTPISLCLRDLLKLIYPQYTHIALSFTLLYSARVLSSEKTFLPVVYNSHPFSPTIPFIHLLFIFKIQIKVEYQS